MSFMITLFRNRRCALESTVFHLSDSRRHHRNGKTNKNKIIEAVLHHQRHVYNQALHDIPILINAPAMSTDSHLTLSNPSCFLNRM